MKSKFISFHVLRVRAQFAMSQAQEKEALMLCREALALAKEMGYVFVCCPMKSNTLCMKALEAGIEVEYVQDVIRKRNLIPDSPPLHLENWPWSVKIYTLGRFGLLRDDRPIRFSRKVQHRPMSMLKVLIALGGRGVREDQTSDILWPDASGDMAHKSFTMTLHRLRTLLGYEKAVQLNEGRLTLDQRYCWVDVWAFERLLGEAETRWREDQPEAAVNLTENAFGLYKGPFLKEDSDEPWAMSMSERVRSKFLRSVGRAGNYWQEAGQIEKAVDCYIKGIEVDNLAEDFYHGLMQCYCTLGRKADAVTTYQKCRKILTSMLGVDPSQKTETLYQSLMTWKDIGHV